jgi:hypothetical protein
MAVCDGLTFSTVLSICSALNGMGKSNQQAENKTHPVIELLVMAMLALPEF